MKGLLIKDLRIVLKRKQSLLVLLGFCALIAFTADGSFVVAYSAGLTGIMGLSTFAYDSHDNGFPFLFSLPVDPKTYVRAKYLFCILCDLAGLAAGTVLFLIACAARGQMDAFREDLVYLLLYFPATLLLIFSTLLNQMIFGIEKSRIVTLVLYGLLFVGSAVIVKVVGPVGQDGAARQMPEWMNNVFLIGSAFSVLVAGVCFGLYLISVRVMRNKEF